MTTRSAVFISSKRVENAQTAQYTSAAQSIVDKFTVTNTTGSTATFSCNVVPSGQGVSDANLIVSARSIAAGECYACPELVGRRLEPGDFLSTLSDTANALTMRAEGRVIL